MKHVRKLAIAAGATLALLGCKKEPEPSPGATQEELNREVNSAPTAQERREADDNFLGMPAAVLEEAKKQQRNNAAPPTAIGGGPKDESTCPPEKKAQQPPDKKSP